MSSSRAVKPLTLLKIAQLGNLLGVSAEGGNLSVLVKRGLCNAALRVGFIIVPHILPEYVSISGDDLVTLIRQNHGEALSSLYPMAHLLLELGMSIVMGNGQYEISEIRQLSYVLERNFSLSDLEVRALTALKALSSIYPPNMDRVASMLTLALPIDDCRRVARMMVTVGAAGSIDSGKIIALRKLYAALGLDERDLYQLMMNFRHNDSGIIEIEPVFGASTPNRDSMFGRTFKLDLELIASKKQETELVGMLLSEIFAGED